MKHSKRTKTPMCSGPSKAGATFGLLLAAIFVLGSVGLSLANDSIRVMTRNLYQGTNFDDLINAPPAMFVQKAAEAYQNILNSKPAERAAAVAREIVRHRVDLVGIQEATILRNRPIQAFPPNASFLPATNVVSDGLQLLLAALRKLGEPYEVIAVVPGIDAEVPTALGIDARLTLSDVIIARTRGADFKLSNVQVQGFLVDRSFPVLGGMLQIPNPRGWASVDVEKNGRKFRFATAHLETSDFPAQPLQAYDMIKGAGNTSLPLVFAGDFNTLGPTGVLTYGQFLGAGFIDAWTQKRPSDAGLTCCQAPNLLNPTSLFDQRIDLVLFRGAFHVDDIRLVGERPGDKTPSGLWPSDHAGVVATLRAPRGH